MRILLIILFSSFFIQCGTSSSGKTASATESVIPNETNKEVICFVYHRFGDTRYPSTNISLTDFEAHLIYLKEQNYQVLTFEDAIKHLAKGGEYKKTAVLTIDDGYESFYKNGLPLLEKYGFPATLFINTETVGGNSYMDWEQLSDANNRGIEIGNHTHSHDYFLNLPASERYKTFKSELKKSQQLISKNLNLTPTTFAYPYGELDDKMKSIVKDQGFIGAAAQNSGVMYAGTDLWQCPRFPMSEFYADKDKFISKANMHPIEIVDQNPSTFLIPDKTAKPTLKLTVKNGNLQLGAINCFVQGGKGTVNVKDLGDGTSDLTIQSTSDITNRRRTLYTITLQDKNGGWHWYSHLWINPSIK